MTPSQKQMIAEEVARLANKTSQVNLSIKADVSNATISNMINGVHKQISLVMWRKVQKTLHIDFNWVTAHTTNYNLVYNLLTTAKEQNLSIAISEDAGKGKTHVYREFETLEKNVIHIECKNYWTKKAYIEQLLVQTGVGCIGSTQQLIKRFINHVRGLENPIVIIDQFDKLKDPQLDLYMDLYNDLHGHCAFCLSGVKALEKRILKGVAGDKIGYAELFSRIGRKFIYLDPVSREDVALVCHKNGVTEESEITYIYNNSEGDLRRVRKDIDLSKLRQKQNK